MPGWLNRLLLCLVLCPALAPAAEVIEAFSASLEVQSDGSLLVTERITVQAEGKQIRRGIYRDLPIRYRLPFGLMREAPISLLSLTRDGQPEPVKTERQGAWQRYYFGAADVLLAPGRYQYELRYRAERQLLQHPGVDELYWNVTGNDWNFPIEQASVAVKLPAGARIGQFAAYTGARGEQGQAYRVVAKTDDSLQVQSSAGLPLRHGLTIAVDWPVGSLARPSRAQQLLWLLLDNPGFSLGGLLLLGLFGYYLRTWRAVGRDPQAGLIIVQFAAPAGMPPAQAGYLWQRGFNGAYQGARAFAVWLTDMAIRKHVRLEDGPRAGNFVLTVGEANGADLSAAEQAINNCLFAGKKAQPTLKVGSRYQPRLADALAELAGQLQTQGQQWFSNNRGRWALGLVAAVVASGLTLLLDLHGEPQCAQALAGLIFSWAFALPSAYLLGTAWRQTNWLLGLLALLFVWPVPIGVWMLGSAAAPAILGLLGGYALLVLLAYFLLPAMTPQGRGLLDALEGYRDYLQLAERDVLALAAQAPAMSIALYEQHLPYAMALGVEAQWSARFSAALASGLIDSEQQDYQPDWYQNRQHALAAQAFSLALVSGLSSATSRVASAAESPASSGGSTGGGSSGGGSGGGGGGGW
jgi:uncharacterized membrane protein YgcG